MKPSLEGLQFIKFTCLRTRGRSILSSPPPSDCLPSDEERKSNLLKEICILFELLLAPRLIGVEHISSTAKDLEKVFITQVGLL